MISVDLGSSLRMAVAVAILVVGLIMGLVLRRAVRRGLRRVGVDDAVEGTAFERSVRGVGTTTVGLFAELSAWFVYVVGALAALRVARVIPVEPLWGQLTGFFPNLFIAVIVLTLGFLVGDKVELWAGESLEGVRLPETSVAPTLLKYSVVFIAALVALSQVGVATGALLVLLVGYAAAVLLFSALALRDVLPAAAAGVYLLLQQPYGIGDHVVVGDHEGVVQEVNVFVTRVEGEGREYIVPNHKVFREGVVRVID